MGQGASNTAHADTRHVRPEMLVSELVGEVEEDDYFARSIQVLDTYQLDDPTQGVFNPQDGVELEDAYTLADEGYHNLEHGYVRLSNGTWYIAVLTSLGDGVTGEMFDWWFRNVDNTEKYRWWHPKDHITGSWDPQFYAVMPHEREPGHYIDHIHIVEEKINGVKQSLQIEYLRPSRMFDVTKFADQNITACLVGRIYVRDPSLGLVAAGHLLHMVREIDGKSELRSRFWLGDVTYPETVENILVARMVNYFASFKLVRMMKIPTSMARGIWKHCSEEMNCLKEFLPHYYRTAMEERASLPHDNVQYHNLLMQHQQEQQQQGEGGKKALVGMDDF